MVYWKSDPFSVKNKNEFSHFKINMRINTETSAEAKQIQAREKISAVNTINPRAIYQGL